MPLAARRARRAGVMVLLRLLEQPRPWRRWQWWPRGSIAGATAVKIGVTTVETDVELLTSDDE